jgi:hypothetical protein
VSRTNCAIGKDVVPASFKGVQFYCSEANIEGGRRGAEGEFPFGEDTKYADLGRKIRVYHLTAIFREDDHVSDAQALFDVCESPGPGMLVHPTRGSFMAACREVKVKDPLEDGIGESHAELEFVEANTGFGAGAGAGASGGGGRRGRSLFGIVSTSLNQASVAAFTRDYQPVQVSPPWRQDIASRAQGLANSLLQAVVRTMPADASTSDWRDVMKLADIVSGKAMVLFPIIVNQALETGFVLLAENIPDPAVTYTSMRALANLAAVVSDLPAGVARESEEAVLTRFRTLAGIGMAEAAMARKYGYIGEALEARDQVLAVLVDEVQAAYGVCDNGLFLQLRDYATQVSEMLYGLAYGLPPLIAVDFMGGIHPLVAAYTLYGDATRHRELEGRNMVDANGRFGPIVIGISP